MRTDTKNTDVFVSACQRSSLPHSKINDCGQAFNNYWHLLTADQCRSRMQTAVTAVAWSEGNKTKGLGQTDRGRLQGGSGLSADVSESTSALRGLLKKQSVFGTS